MTSPDREVVVDLVVEDVDDSGGFDAEAVRRAVAEEGRRSALHP